MGKVELVTDVRDTVFQKREIKYKGAEGKAVR